MSKSNKMSRFPHDAKVYVGDLGSNADKQEIEDAFSYYGPLRSVWVARNPPGFAFVEFEDARDAEDAVRGLDGRTICGRRARVELSTGKSARGYRSRGGRRSPGRREDRCYECGNRGHFARDCRRRGGGGGRRGRSRSRSRSRDREYRTRSRSYSRSPPPKRSNKSPRRSKSPRYNDSRVSKSPRRDSRSKSPRSKSISPRSKSRSQSRDDSRSRNGDD